MSDVSADEANDGMRQVSLSVDNDDVFLDNEKGEKSKENRNSNENEKHLVDELEETKRMLSVEEEKAKGYKKENDNKEAALVKERALSKHWKKEMEKEKERNEELQKSLQKEMKASRHVKKQNKRIIEEYYYLRDLYDSRPRNTQLKRSSADLYQYMDDQEEDHSDNEWDEIQQPI